MLFDNKLAFFFLRDLFPPHWKCTEWHVNKTWIGSHKKLNVIFFFFSRLVKHFLEWKRWHWGGFGFMTTGFLTTALECGPRSEPLLSPSPLNSHHELLLTDTVIPSNVPHYITPRTLWAGSRMKHLHRMPLVRHFQTYSTRVLHNVSLTLTLVYF